MKEPASGILLVSDPFLKDPNFMRTVVFLCEHTPEGTLGFVLNRPYEQKLNEFIPELDSYAIPVYYGGPVQSDSLHFLHQMPALIPGGQEVIDGVFWGGDFDKVIQLVHARELDLSRIRFFLGYSGWSAGQLQEEFELNSWLIAPGDPSIVFHDEASEVWRDTIHQMDDKYHPIVHYPIDPQLN